MRMVDGRGDRGAGAYPRTIARTWKVTAALVCAGVLMACGGGGGGGEAPPTTPAAAPAPPQVRVAITADQLELLAGGEQVTLRATVHGTSSIPLWTLEGPGSLSSYTGTTVTYRPPDPEQLDSDAQVTVTAWLSDAYFVDERVRLSVKAVAAPGLTWKRTRAPATRWTDIAWGPGGFVAVGQLRDANASDLIGPYEGVVMHSPDGLSWTKQALPASQPVAGIAWGTAGWLAAGDFGATWSSLDGRTWIALPKAPFNQGVLQVMFANGVYVVSTYEGIHVSADGRSWTTWPVHMGASSIAFGNGVFVATPQSMYGGVWSSPDARQWTQITSTHTRLSSVAFGNGRFVGGGVAPSAFSVDGQTWQSLTPPSDVRGTLSFARDRFFTAGPHSMSSATDGTQWLTSVAPDLHHPFVKVVASPERFVRLSSVGAVGVSEDGASWRDVVEGGPGHLHAIAYADGRFVAVSSRGWALVSPDGHAWQREHLTVGQPTRFLDARAVAFGGGTFAACGRAVDAHLAWNEPGGAAFSARRGASAWAPAATGAIAGTCTGLVHDGRRFLAVTDAGEVHDSLDGTSWSLRARLDGAPKLSGIAFGDGRYLVVGPKGYVATSTDGQAWATKPLAVVGTNTQPYDLYGVTFAEGRFTAVGGPVALATADGSAWSYIEGHFGHTALAVAHGAGRYVATTYAGSVVTGQSGRGWHPRESEVTGHLLAVAYGNGRFVAVGHNGVTTVSER